MQNPCYTGTGKNYSFNEIIGYWILIYRSSNVSYTQIHTCIDTKYKNTYRKQAGRGNIPEAGGENCQTVVESGE